MFMFKNFHSLIRLPGLTALAAVLALLPSIANAARPLVDSTGVKQTVVSTLVMPAQGLSGGDVLNITNNALLDSAIVRGGVPDGYKELIVPMSNNRYLGRDSVGLAASAYYTALGYPATVPAAPVADCGANTTPRVAVRTTPAVDREGGAPDPAYSDYYVCEPQGTRSTLVKIIGASLLNVTRPMIDLYTKPGAIGMSVQAASAFCQVSGYTNYVPSTVVSSAINSCDRQLTRWNGSAFYNDSACYNSALQSMQCWK